MDDVDSAKSGDPWYKEVADLRKQAYQFRVRHFHQIELSIVLINIHICPVPRVGNRLGARSHERDLSEADGRAIRASEKEGVSVGIGVGHDIAQVRNFSTRSFEQCL